ncbi:hypothetical protein TPR58_14300 [Sphingomonas sp. HF-S3]|uniref:Baseplate protein J-like domain-containing protein n=1 Tax=Sphingomonas rustica TaxID=3103142 RepID=A0ABV0BAT7_9SPHN
MTVLRYLQPRIKEMSNGMFANWMPTNQVEVGDYGVVRNGQFERLGSLRDYGADFEVADASGGRNKIEYKDRFDIKVNAGVGAHAPGQSAKVSLKSGGRGSFVYHLANAVQRRPVNTRAFNEEVARTLLDSGIDFPKNGVLITEVQFADKATIIVSDQDNGSLELETSFKPAGDAFLSGASGKITTVASTGTFLQWVGQDKMISLIKIVIPKVSPPRGPDNNPGRVAATIEKVRDWIQEKRVGAAQLRISYQENVTPVTVISIPGAPGMITMELEAMSAAEIVMTMEEAEDSSFEMEIEEEDFGEQQSGVAYG